MKEKHKKIFQFLLLVIVIFVCSSFVYNVHHDYSGFIQNPHINSSLVEVSHFSYPFPIHVDEWIHLSQIVYILENKSLGFVNPYSSHLIFQQDPEVGYHLILATFFKISSLDPILTYQYFATIFFIINSILLFILIKKLTNNYYIGLLSIVFFLAIPTNSNILGNWFAVPLTFSLSLIFLFFIFLTDFFKTNNKLFLLSSIIFYLFSFCYPVATAFITLITFFYLIFEFKIYKRFNKKKFFIILGVGFILLIALLFKGLVFSRTWTNFQYDYSLIFFYGLLPMLFAIFGIYFVLTKKMNRIFFIWPLICLINLIVYKIFGFGLFIPYERILFYYLLGLAPLAAIGLFYLFKSIWVFLYEKVIKNKKVLSLILVSLLVGVCFYFTFQNYYPIKSEGNFGFIQILDQEDYNAIKFIEQNYGEKNIILADPFISLGIYPIGKNFVVSIESSNLGYGNPKTAGWFFMSSCEDKQKIILPSLPNFVLSKFKLNCSFLVEKYNKGDYIYQVKYEKNISYTSLQK
ncbi:Uncharacterised protein [uncultured archaeon]|nr:Uncharacterised protein [uncultured archaeon]